MEVLLSILRDIYVGRMPLAVEWSDNCSSWARQRTERTHVAQSRRLLMRSAAVFRPQHSSIPRNVFLICTRAKISCISSQIVLDFLRAPEDYMMFSRMVHGIRKRRICVPSDHARFPQARSESVFLQKRHVFDECGVLDILRQQKS